MKRLAINLEVIIAAMEDGQLPDQDRLVDLFTDYVYKYHTGDNVYIEIVSTTHVNGEPVNFTGN